MSYIVSVLCFLLLISLSVFMPSGENLPPSVILAKVCSESQDLAIAGTFQIVRNQASGLLHVEPDGSLIDTLENQFICLKLTYGNRFKFCYLYLSPTRDEIYIQESPNYINLTETRKSRDSCLIHPLAYTTTVPLVSSTLKPKYLFTVYPSSRPVNGFPLCIYNLELLENEEELVAR